MTEQTTIAVPVPVPATVGALSTTGAAEAAATDTAAILSRLDALGAQVAVMAEQVASADAARARWAELAETLVPVTRGALDVATAELEDLSADVSLDDVTRFARTTVRAAPRLEGLVGQLGSVAELGHELNSLSGAGVAKLTDVLAVAEGKGYFMFARRGAAIADRIVTSYTEDDVEALGDNVVTILDTLKELTQPEVMALLNRTARTIQDVEETPTTPPSALALLRSMRDPQTRRGLGRVLAMLHAIGAQQHESPESGALHIKRSGSGPRHPSTTR
jgi:uncharacterized protein YjgD (DUF1641 family)